jgi:hypothetical protein
MKRSASGVTRNRTIDLRRALSGGEQVDQVLEPNDAQGGWPSVVESFRWLAAELGGR